MIDRAKTSGLRRTRAWLTALLTFAFAAPIAAAELIAIRVGEHPTFTRVVFELDVAGGYRIERNADGEAANVVRVTLDAASDDRRMKSRSPGVSSVSVEAGSPRSVARIETRDPSWPIKEMILTDPPRVVLDFMNPEPVAAPKLAAAASVANDTGSDPPARAVEASPVPKNTLAEGQAPATAPEPIPAGSEPVPEALAVETAQMESTEPLAADAQADLDELAAAPVEAVDGMEAIDTESAVEELAELAPSAGDLDADGEIPEPAGRPERSTTQESPSDSISVGTAAAIAAALLASIGVAFVVMRRRKVSADEDIDVTTMFPDQGAADDRPVPKEGLHNAPESGGSASSKAGAVATGSNPPPADPPGAAPGIFDDALEEKEAMTMDNTDVTIGSDASEAPTQLGLGAAGMGRSTEDSGGSNIVRIIQDMESRIAHLEARLDESVEARQQLERQVSAQTEELRVQRAAIARTQRALRGLNRSDEEQATEPALRNPDRPPVSE